MMRCDDVTSLLLEDGWAPGPEVTDHMAACAECRALAAAHRDALGLQRLQVPAQPLLEPEEVLGMVRRWRTRRVALAGVAVMAAVLLWARAPRDAVEAPLMEQPVLAEVPAQAQAQPPTLAQLLVEVGSYTHRDVATQDAAYASFGSLAMVLSPAPSQALLQHGFQESFPFFVSSSGAFQ
jgi:predicted anti-sigma-YlaC factor YlaD